MANEAEAAQLSKLDPQGGPKSPEIGTRTGFMATVTGTRTPGHKVPFHLFQQALAEAIANRKRG